MHQVVDVRGTACPLTFGSRDDELAFADEVRAMRAAMTSDFCIAPRCRVETLRGVLVAGDPISVADLAPEVGRDGHQRIPRERLESMVRKGVVLAREET